MRISHREKFVFLSNPRSGSETVRKLLDSKSDLRVDKHIKYENFLSICSANIKHTFLYPHSPATVVRDFFKFKGWDWNSYFKFTTIRNPWDKIVSIYHYGRPDNHNRYFWEDNYDPQSGLAEFKSWLLNKGVYFYPITYFAFEGEKCLVDKIIKIEEIDTDIPMVLANFGIEIKSVPKTNATKHDNYRKYYDSETAQLVGDKFKKDIEIGEYTF